MDDFTPLSISPSTLLPAFIILLLLLHYYRRRRQPTAVLPPSPPKLPLIGHLHLLTDMPHHDFSNISNTLGPLIYLQLGRVPTIVVSSSRLAREILKTQDHIFSNRPQIIAGQYLSFGCSDITFSPYGAYWRQARKICVTELLSPKRVNSFQLIRNEEVNLLINSLTHTNNSSTPEIDMSDKFFGLANNVLCRVAFGKRFSTESNRLPEILTETQALLAGFSIADFYPGLEWVNSVTGLKKRLLKNLNDLKSVCDEIIGEHLKKKNEESDDLSDREDFVDVLLRVQKGGDLDVPISDDNLKALVLDMFVAGTDTTSATLEWTMTELSRHPHIMSKTQKEVREIVGMKGVVDLNHLPHLNYMRAIIKETLRLHPPVPLLVPRESLENCKIDGYDIPAKTRVFINTYAIGRDPTTWPNPLEYNPERFMENGKVDIDVKGHQDFDLLPFGGGRRGCPGYSFALATIEITLARLLYHFDWSLPRGVRPDDVDLNEIFGLATRKKVPLVLVPTINEDYVFNGVLA